MKRTMEVIGHDGNSGGSGARVELHPATDLWMAGARYGTISSVARDGSAARVSLDIGGTYIVHARNLRVIA